jgi:hypothetical protein
MREHAASTRWSRHFIYRAEHTRTTWKLRIGFLAMIAVAVWLTSGWWSVSIARSLVVEASLAPSDAILVENFDADYLLFQHARELRRAGFAPRVLVPVGTDSGTMNPNAVALGIAEVMAKISHIGQIEIIPVREVEPITINALRDVQSFLEQEHIRSLIVVTPLFRSRRSALVYGATLGRAGVTLYYQPVQRSRGINTWTRTWHGVQEVLEHWLKLQYYRYRLSVMPFS